jgi:hypothetical protein
MIIAGIDYSMSCPAICVYDSEDGKFSYSNTKIYFRSNLQRFEKFDEDNISAENHGPWKTEEDRYDDIATWAMSVLYPEFTDLKIADKIFLEGYSYGSTGRVFHIAENTAILKHEMWGWQMNFEIIPPTVIKKFATGKGNANKELMYEAFESENPGINLRSRLTPRSSNIISPVSDIVDSYFIAKCGFDTCKDDISVVEGSE